MLRVKFPLGEFWANIVTENCSIKLLSDVGLLHIYPHEKVRLYWNKNHPKDVELIFLNKDLIVNNIGLLKANSSVLITSTIPCKYLIEVESGTCKERGIKVGQSMEFENEKTES